MQIFMSIWAGNVYREFWIENLVLGLKFY